jgi:hypothetical protein
MEPMREVFRDFNFYGIIHKWRLSQEVVFIDSFDTYLKALKCGKKY